MRVCLDTILIIIHLNLNCDLVIMNKQTSFMQRKKKYGNLINRLILLLTKGQVLIFGHLILNIHMTLV